MIVDSSVLVAILLGEPETARLGRALLRNPDGKLPSSCLLEASMIALSRRGEAGILDLDILVMRLGLELLPFTPSQARVAREAFRRYGKGRHAAGLNFGDCMAYAAARELGEELLFKGTDFGLTDVAVAKY